MAENSTNSTVTWEVNADGSRVRREKKFYLVSYDSYVQKDYHKGILYFRLVKSLREATALSMAEVEEHRRAVSNHSNGLKFYWATESLTQMNVTTILISYSPQ